MPSVSNLGKKNNNLNFFPPELDLGPKSVDLITLCLLSHQPVPPLCQGNGTMIPPADIRSSWLADQPMPKFERLDRMGLNWKSLKNEKKRIVILFTHPLLPLPPSFLLRSSVIGNKFVGPDCTFFYLLVSPLPIQTIKKPSFPA